MPLNQVTECRANTAVVSERFKGAVVPSELTYPTYSLSTGSLNTYTSPEAVFADEIRETGISALAYLVSVITSPTLLLSL